MVSGLIDLDRNVYLWLNSMCLRPRLVQFSRSVSHSGDGYLYMVIALSVYFLALPNYLLFINTAVLAFAIELPGFLFLKSMIKRDRPYVHLSNSEKAITPSDKFSMPSGHTAAAFLMAGLIAGFYPQFGPLVYLWACGIGLSRVVLGVHYPSDVIAGAVLGSWSCLIALALTL